MKVMKLALLGTAALAAVSVSARADDLADLKAQIEALNSRISQLEAAPAVPAGYQLLSVSQAPAIVVPTLDIDPAYGANATNIGILPTADVPASTVIQWSGFVRSALFYGETDYELAGYPDYDSIDIYTRGEIKVVGTTDTAVGEVGALMKLRADFEGLGNASVSSPEAWGWWKMTPELTLGAGYTGSLANIGYGYDGACNCYFSDSAPVALNPGRNDTTQMRLSYASGPLAFAIALEDADYGYNSDTLGVAAEFKYSGDVFNAELAGGVWDENTGSAAYGDAWQLGVGVGFNLSDMFTISAGLAAGEQHFQPVGLGGDYWKGSILLRANLSDAVSAEIAYGHAEYDARFTGFGGFLGNVDVDAVLAGIYYDPVAQLTIGLEGEWWQEDSNLVGGDEDHMSLDLVTVFRF
jgi:hypothetical protein